MRRLLPHGFTFLEILFSILVFSIGMLAYFNYQAKATVMLFEAESANIATALAAEIVEEINSLSEEDFRALVGSFGEIPTPWMYDDEIKTVSSFLQFRAGPLFNSFGNPATSGTGFFERQVRITTFNAFTGSSFPENSPHEVLRIVEVWVRWPTRSHTLDDCTGGPGSEGCHHIVLRSIKATEYY